MINRTPHCSELLTTRSSECNVWFGVARQKISRTVDPLQSRTKKAPSSLIEPRETSDETQARHITEDNIDTEPEELAELGAFKNVRVKRTKALACRGMLNLYSLRRHHVIFYSTEPLHTSTHPIAGYKEHNEEIIGPFVYSHRVYLYPTIPGQPPDAAKQIHGLNDDTKLATPPVNRSGPCRRLFVRCSICNGWHRAHLVQTLSAFEDWVIGSIEGLY